MLFISYETMFIFNLIRFYTSMCMYKYVQRKTPPVCMLQLVLDSFSFTRNYLYKSIKSLLILFSFIQSLPPYQNNQNKKLPQFIDTKTYAQKSNFQSFRFPPPAYPYRVSVSPEQTPCYRLCASTTRRKSRLGGGTRSPR